MSANGLQAFLALVVTVVFLTATGVIATVVLVTALGHGWDAYVKLRARKRW